MTDSSLLDDAIEYYFPLYEMARTRARMTQDVSNPARRDLNAWFHQKSLADHRARVVTTPNHDTLYSTIWLDLQEHCAWIEIPPIANRYWSLAFLDMFTNNFAMVGSRLGDGENGEKSVRVLLLGPHADAIAAQRQCPAPPDRIVRAPGADVWILARWLVSSPDDVAQARSIQAGVKMQMIADKQPVSGEVFLPDWQPAEQPTPQEFRAVVDAYVHRNPLPAHERVLQQAWEPLWQAADWGEAFFRALTGIRRGRGVERKSKQGWLLPQQDTGNFGANYALRAAVALGGLAALEPAEAVYLSTSVDADAERLQGANSYRLKFPAGGIPARAFWSVCVYEIMPDGRLFFFDNPIRRYAMGNRSEGLVGPLGQVADILLQHTSPGAGKEALWLPTPAGAFRLMVRAYEPEAELIRGESELPRIEKLN